MEIALSGMVAAQTRLAASAQNVANAATTSTVKNGETVSEAYQAVQVQQVSQAEGGTHAKVLPAEPPTYRAYDAAQRAIVEFPNVDLASEAVNQVEAVNAYRASAIAYETQAETENSILDICG